MMKIRRVTGNISRVGHELVAAEESSARERNGAQ
jgi:hypothetical protein